MQEERNAPFLLFLSVLLGGLLWVVVVPLFHTPDEQAHLAQVAYIASTGQNPQGDTADLTRELFSAEQLLGTERDAVGNNRFTFHPEYKIEYTNSTVGKYEREIATFSGTIGQGEMVKQEASRYPILYYWPAAKLYSFFLLQNLFFRVFVIRLWSLALFLLTVFFSYRIGAIFFRNNRLMATTAAMLVGFQPMMVFANIGVTSDALGNLLFTLFIYHSLAVLTGKSTRYHAIFLLAVSLLCWYTKPQFLVVLPLLILLILMLMLRSGKKSAYLWTLGATVGSGLIFSVFIRYRIGLFLLAGPVWSAFDLTSFLKFTREYTVSHSVSEVLPWYWGIYKWLGVTYPRWVHRIINRVVAAAVIGLVVWGIQSLRKKQWKGPEFLAVCYLFTVSSVFFGFLALYDWYLWHTSTFVLGVQGRYYFPLIAATMCILLLGIRSLLPGWKNLDRFGAAVIGIGVVLLHGYGLWTVMKAYYDVSNSNTLLMQISQYKPWFVKGPWLAALAGTYLLSTALFLFSYLGEVANPEKENTGT